MYRRKVSMEDPTKLKRIRMNGRQESQTNMTFTSSHVNFRNIEFSSQLPVVFEVNRMELRNGGMQGLATITHAEHSAPP
jgi:hypothetical protein